MHLHTYMEKLPAPASKAERRQRLSQERSVKRAEEFLGRKLNIRSNAGWERQLDRMVSMTMADWADFQRHPESYLE